MTRRAPVGFAFAVALALAAALALAPGCGGDDERLRVAAASSLRPALERYASASGESVSVSFGGSDELAAQVRSGGRPDVLAVASPAIAARLFRAGRLERPVRFAANRVVLAAPAGGRVRSLAEAARPGVAVAIGAPGVPVGDYARAALRRAGRATAGAVAANVRSAEPDAAGIVAKLARGGVDAGFVYATDVRAAGGRLRAIELPARARPRVTYAAAVVRGARHPTRAREFVAGLRQAAGRRALRAAGFAPLGR